MGDIVLTVAIVVLACAGLFYCGAKYGAAVEQDAVAEVLAFHSKTASAQALVHAILLSLKGEYARAYLAIKKALVLTPSSCR